MRLRTFILIVLTAGLALPGAASPPTPAQQSRFISLRSFSSFIVGLSTNSNETVLISPVFKAPIAWDQLIVSWNAVTPGASWIKVEATGIYPDRATKYYTLGIWTSNPTNGIRRSVGGQADADGTVNTDTLVLNRPGADLQLRLTLSAPDDAHAPRLKFLWLSFLDSRITNAPLPPIRSVWGKIIGTPELSQHGYPEGEGWCSPASLAMVLTRWGEVQRRPDLEVGVPAVAAAVNDPALPGTGNWVFNTAYAGSFPNMRAYVTRLSDISELEDWISDGIPVVISAPWHLLSPGRKDTGSGHLAVVIGFTNEGDLVINDPATNLEQGQRVRHIYSRENVIKAWSQSHNTVYLVYPETVQIPGDRYGQWESP